MGPVGHPPAWPTPALLPPSYPHLSKIIKDPAWATAMALDFTPSVAWGIPTRPNRPLAVQTCSLERCSRGQGGPRVEPRGDGCVDAGSQGRTVWAHEAAGGREALSSTGWMGAGRAVGLHGRARGRLLPSLGEQSHRLRAPKSHVCLRIFSCSGSWTCSVCLQLKAESQGQSPQLWPSGAVPEPVAIAAPSELAGQRSQCAAKGGGSRRVMGSVPLSPLCSEVGGCPQCSPKAGTTQGLLGRPLCSQDPWAGA